MKQSNALQKPYISANQIESLIVQREAMASMKKRLQMMEESVAASEQAILCLIEDGAEIDPGYALQVKTSERRYPSWKDHFASIMGADAAAKVLAETIPTIYKTLVVKVGE